MIQRLKSVLMIAFVSISSLSYSQKENNVWMMGNLYPDPNNGISFNTGTADTFSITRNLLIFTTNASICDSSGQLLFYTNGIKINNRNHDSLCNSDGFNPGWLTDYYQFGMGLPQGAFVISRPGHYGQYYLFHESGELCEVDSHIVSQPVNLSYSLIDMSLDSGLGGIVPGFKNIHVIDDTLIYGRMTGVKHANGRDWWIVVHRSDSDLYYTVLVTPDSILGPYSQNIGRPHKWELLSQQAAFSPTGDQYVIELTAEKQTLHNVIDLFDFDRCTGTFSNHREVIIPDTLRLALGCSFSPNGRYLYISNSRNIYQYDTYAANINNYVAHVATWDSFMSPLKTIFYSHLLAPDGRIYISTLQGSNVLHYINNPDQPDTLCNVIQNSFFLPQPNNFAMPNAPNFSLGPVNGSICDSLSLGIDDNAYKRNLSLSISPNPAQNMFSLSYQLPNGVNASMHIYNTLGVEVMSKNLYWYFGYLQIDASALNDGVYFMKVITTDRHSANAKLVIAK